MKLGQQSWPLHERGWPKGSAKPEPSYCGINCSYVPQWKWHFAGLYSQFTVLCFTVILYFCKVCCHNTIQYCSFTKVICKIYSRILIIVFTAYCTIFTQSTHCPTLVAGGECSLQNRFNLFTVHWNLSFWLLTEYTCNVEKWLQ